MKKCILYFFSLWSVWCGSVLASATPDVGTPVTPNAVTPPVPTPKPSIPIPAPSSPTAKPESAPLPTSSQPTTTPAPLSTPVTPVNKSPNSSAPLAPSAAPVMPAVMDCTYHIPAETTQISHDIILKWAEKAAIQSFHFDFHSINQELDALKMCYTDQGWKGFNDALQKSGNLQAIKSQQLTVIGNLMGTGHVTDVKENQWKVSLPMQVTYQNAKDKIMQSLTINLVVGRKVSGDLGIMQMIATPTTGTPTPQNQ